MTGTADLEMEDTGGLVTPWTTLTMTATDTDVSEERGSRDTGNLRYSLIAVEGIK